MDHNFKKEILRHLSAAAETDNPVSVNQNGEPLAIVLSAANYQKFQAKSEARLKYLKAELDSILALVQSYTQRRSLEDVEAWLVALRKKIEQEMSE